MLEVMASGGSPAEAKAVTDAVAEQLVKTSNDRFQGDAAKAVDTLKRQVKVAGKEFQASTRATARYQTENGISAAATIGTAAVLAGLQAVSTPWVLLIVAAAVLYAVAPRSFGFHRSIREAFA